MEEANEEADHHAYCTTELATNKQTRENKASEAEELAAQAEQLAAEAAQLGEEIQQLSDAMAEIEGERAARTTLRKEEKAANMKTISDAKEAQVAVEQAIQVLRSFYAKAADAAVQLQSAANYASGLHTQAPYKGLQDETTGVMGMLDVILSDFARLETETSAAEEQAVVAYEKFMAETTEDLQVKRTTKEHKESKRQRTEEALRSAKKELQLTQEELTRALDYYDKLKADCLDDGLSYQERRARRQEEIQSLQEALNILNGEDLA
uniref:Uncharacterized protein n=1 Tax=Pyrodinium bahamense TaxID=73915 RepID=A0A7S0FCT2_9DINO|mmetsp:Transcript_22912/g.63769  ORF Transcript_22912/g.63769 Transcript_22912/m.63769 type:complete len:266 (+) Transcript_22912:2-799(+)